MITQEFQDHCLVAAPALVSEQSCGQTQEQISGILPELGSLLESWKGFRFRDDTFRILWGDKADLATGILWRCCPDSTQQVYAFGDSWNGQIFGVAFQGPAKGQVFFWDWWEMALLATDHSLTEFLQVDLLRNKKELLDYKLYKSWLNAGGQQAEPSECISWAKLGVLGGEDEVSNLDRIDREVYWEISTQLWEKVRDLPDGTAIGNVNVS